MPLLNGAWKFIDLGFYKYVSPCLLYTSVRASLALYNTYEDIDALVAALLRLQADRGHRSL